MARVADLWEDAQHHFGFEGLLLHCKGVTNELADRASRKDDADVQRSMEEAAEAEGVGQRGCRRVPAVWTFGEERVDILDELIALTSTANNLRQHHKLTHSASHLPLPL